MSGFLVVCMFALVSGDDAASQWESRFAMQSPPREASGVCLGKVGDLPAFEVAAPTPGRFIVRASLPFPAAALPDGMGVIVNGTISPDVRPLTWHPGSPKSVRRALLSFSHDFADSQPVRFTLELNAVASAETVPSSLPFEFTLGNITYAVTAEGCAARNAEGGELWHANPIAPPCRESQRPAKLEVVEWGQHIRHIRILKYDDDWPRIMELQFDTTGTVCARVHLQRLAKGDDFTPELGWQTAGLATQSPVHHAFAEGAPLRMAAGGNAWFADFPEAHELRRGRVDWESTDLRYTRCIPSDSVPMQETAWREAALILTQSPHDIRSPLFEPSTNVRVSPAAYEPLYDISESPDLTLFPDLNDLTVYTRKAITRAALKGDDFGNVTAFNAAGAPGVFGMNRLNHCPAIFHEAWRSGNAGLRKTALLWCANMFDLSLWWRETDEFGGTRYNNAVANGEKAHEGDKSYMWRGNNAVHFCTKGYDSFLYAYEETGDPRMLIALNAQVAYAKKHVHTDQGECRNIGDAVDFMSLYRCTGDKSFLDEAMRLFRELRTKLSPGDLFSQGGQLIAQDGPFIDDDKHGYDAPFAKPYIIGYALAGLPDLLRECPDEPKLRDVVRAVADFLASAQDPVGGWRYPHPQSSRTIVDQGMEHAVQLARAADILESRTEPISNLLDAMERTLQARLLAFMKTGTFFSGLGGWETNPGMLKEGQTIYDLYQKPADRSTERDYSEGLIGTGSGTPEGMAHFFETLAFYLKHRPADRLYKANERLAQVLARMQDVRATPPTVNTSEVQQYGLSKDLPAFRDAQVARMTFPLAWENTHKLFGEWRAEARAKYLGCLPPRQPLAPFNAQIIAEEDRGEYVAQKVAINVTADERVTVYLLSPKSPGPHPAVLALHDHGAHFTIGKEKTIRPVAATEEIINDSEDWVGKCYGGRFYGDELAKRGYVVLSGDALFWGERGRLEGADHKAQERFAANMFQLGTSWAGKILWDDMRYLEFLRAQPGVAPERVAAMGLSVGCYRTWSLCAATDDLKAGVAICWMGDTQALTTPGNNQTTGQSAFCMIHPDIRNWLDYPDVASLACPKPMLFYAGEKDGLFPVEGVNRAFAKLRKVWDDQGTGSRLETKLWPVPHEYNAEMQEEAFKWLDSQMKEQ